MVAPEMIVAQVDAVASDIGVDAVKVGMLADETTIEAVVDALELIEEAPVVVDPVMIAESGATLLDPNAKAALIERILPRATVVTPEPARGPGALRARGGGDPGRARRRGSGARTRGGGRHRRPFRRRRRPARRRRRLAADRGTAIPGRRLARVRLHPLVGAGRLPRPRRGARRRGALGEGDRRRGGRQRPARDRPRRRARGRVRDRAR